MNRIKILEDAILRLSGREEQCICTTIAFVHYRDVFQFKSTFIDFPEFLKYKPADSGLYWFRKDDNGNASRVAIMLLVLDEICRAEKRD